MRKPMILATLALLGACSEQADKTAGAKISTYNVAESAAGEAESAAAETPPPAAIGARRAAVAPADAAASAVIPVSQPRIAYTYQYGYRLGAERIPELQRAHADLCEKQGPLQCRIIEMRQSGGEGEYASGSLALAVAAPRARAFGTELARSALAEGGKEISAAISGEDLSKQMVDTEARLRARTLLRDRLMEVLASRKGTVTELVEAERGVAQVNEEIDQARGWLAEMRGRVDFSRMDIAYSSGSPEGGGFSAPIRAAFGSIGSILGIILAVLIVVLTVGVPLALLVGGVIWTVRRGRATLRQMRPREPVTAIDPPD